MKLSQLNESELRRVGQEFARERLALLRAVELPDCFRPPVSDVVLLGAGPDCEIYLDASVAYDGDLETHTAPFGAPELPGGARAVLQVRGGALDGLEALGAWLQAAAGHPAAGHRAAEPEEAATPPGGNAPLPGGRPLAGGEDLPAHLRALELTSGDPGRFAGLFGRAQELRSLATALSRESKHGAVIVGPSGVGKTALVELLARRVLTGEVPAPLQGARIFELPLGRALEQADGIGFLERWTRGLLEQPGRPIFFCDELHVITRPELAPLLDLWKPAMARGGLRILGATTPEEWREVRDRAFRRRLTEIPLAEPAPLEALEMLRRRAVALEAHHNIRFTEEDLRRAIALSVRYLPERHLPDKAVDLLDHAAARQGNSGEPVLEWEERG